MNLLVRGLIWLLVAFPAIAQNPVTTITFYKQIAPIIYKNCSQCHRPGESAPFSLLSYEDVKRHASTIAKVTESRYMPPWLPDTGHGEFAEERRLSDSEVQLIQDWVKHGSPAGPAANAPAPPKFTTEWQMGKPDLVLRATRPYKMPAGGSEVFWNFIMPVPITTTRWVKAVEIRPGNARVFHHANIVLDRSRGARRHEISPGAGFPGMDLVFEEETFDPDGHFLSWKPGSEPVVEPDGMAWRADPGMDMVLNVHLRSTGKEETVSPLIGLYFTDKPQTRFPMLVQLEHDSVIDIPPGDRDFVVSDDFRSSLDLNVLAVYPHAHYLAKTMEGYATLPDGTRKWLIRISNWDLNWQGVFRFKKPVFLPRGTTISMRYHYDNSADNARNPNNPPARVVGGNEATQEMGHFWLQVLPAADGDQRMALQEALVQQRLQKYPDDFSANYNMGDLLLSRGDAGGSLPYFEKAAKADSGSVFAATDLGVALFTASKLPEAEAQFKRALALDPAYADARFDLASEEAASGQFDAAAADFKRVLDEKPDHEKAREHLGQVYVLWGDQLAKGGKDDQAEARYREALTIRPDDVDLHIRLGMTFARMERLSESQAEFETVLRLQPDSSLARQAIDAIQKRMKATGKQ
jgi:tetratricopeptide (TPR) repeat protein/mono/diheme cytochrome c family protein